MRFSFGSKISCEVECCAKPFLLAVLTLGALSITSSVALAANGPTLTVASPANNANVGAPVYFEATATTTTCPFGISAIRIYEAPNVSVFTTDGFHLETFVALQAGTYNTVIQAWDNCGNVTKVSRTITVNQKAGVTVFLPAAGANTTPVHFAVSAQSPGCSGISAVRIYPQPFVNAYTLNGSSLDAYINLIPGTYGAVAQAWDNCGHVFKTPITIQDTGGPAGKYLYVADQNLSNVAQYTVTNGALSIPGGGAGAPTYGLPAKANSAVVHPSGNFLYVGTGRWRGECFSNPSREWQFVLRRHDPVRRRRGARHSGDGSGGELPVRHRIWIERDHDVSDRPQRWALDLY